MVNYVNFLQVICVAKLESWTATVAAGCDGWVEHLVLMLPNMTRSLLIHHGLATPSIAPTTSATWCYARHVYCVVFFFNLIM